MFFIVMLLCLRIVTGLPASPYNWSASSSSTADTSDRYYANEGIDSITESLNTPLLTDYDPQEYTIDHDRLPKEEIPIHDAFVKILNQHSEDMRRIMKLRLLSSQVAKKLVESGVTPCRVPNKQSTEEQTKLIVKYGDTIHALRLKEMKSQAIKAAAQGQNHSISRLDKPLLRSSSIQALLDRANQHHCAAIAAHSWTSPTSAAHPHMFCPGRGHDSMLEEISRKMEKAQKMAHQYQ